MSPNFMVVVKLTNYPERQPIQRKAQPSKAEPIPSREELAKYGTKEKPGTAVIERASGQTEYVKEGKVVAVKGVVTEKAIQTGAPPETTQPTAAAIVQQPTMIPFTQPTRQIPPPDVTQFTAPRVIAKEETKPVTPTIDISKIPIPKTYTVLQPSPKQPILTKIEEFVKRKTEGKPIAEAIAGATIGTTIGLVETGKEAIDFYYQVYPDPFLPRIKGITPEFNPPEAAAKVIGVAKEIYTEPSHIIPFFAFLDLPKEQRTYYGGGKAIGETALLFIPELKAAGKIAKAEDVFNLRNLRYEPFGEPVISYEPRYIPSRKLGIAWEITKPSEPLFTGKEFKLYKPEVEKPIVPPEAKYGIAYKGTETTTKYIPEEKFGIAYEIEQPKIPYIEPSLVYELKKTDLIAKQKYGIEYFKPEYQIKYLPEEALKKEAQYSLKGTVVPEVTTKTGIIPLEANPLKTPENIYLSTEQSKLFEDKYYAVQKETGLRTKAKIINHDPYVYEPYLDKYVEFNPKKYSLVTESPNIMLSKEMIEKLNPKEVYPFPREKETPLSKFGFPTPEEFRGMETVLPKEAKPKFLKKEVKPFESTVYEAPEPFISKREIPKSKGIIPIVLQEGEFYKDISINARIGIKPHPQLLFVPEEIPTPRVKGVVREIGGVVYNPFERLPSTNRLIPYVVPKYSIYQILEPKQEQPIIQLPKQEIVPYYITDLQPLQITKQKIEQISAPTQEQKPLQRQRQELIQIPKQKEIQEQVKEPIREVVKIPKYEFKQARTFIPTPLEPLRILKKPSKEEPEEPIKKKGLFGVEVRKRGKFLPFGKRLTEEEAFTIGETITEKTAAASFRITPEEKEKELNISKFLPRSRFYESTKEKNVFIQLPQKRITSIGEKQEITFKGIEATRRKNIFKLR